MKIFYFIPVCVSLIITQSVTAYAQSHVERDTSVENSLEIFSSVYRKVIESYPVIVEPNQLVVTGIQNMLHNLDPFTTFFPEDEVSDFRQNLSGRFGGVGLVMGQSEEGIFIVELFPNKPADRAGLKKGDFLREIDGVATKGMSMDEVRSLLIGIPGSTITINVNQLEEKKITSFSFKREIININAVPYYGMLTDGTAYINLARESEEAGAEVKAALKDLYDRHHFKSIILDLRGNEGGHLREALKVANLFVNQGSLLTSIREKNTDTIYYAMDVADYPSIPLVLLTDHYTASSGEILTGAIQDNDRAIIIGQKTYGKGLVQVLFDMPGGTLLKMTTGHYYTPSGRCIQAFEYNEGVQTMMADSLKKEFTTKNGRKVFSSGGITPDITTDAREVPAILQTLLHDSHISDFAARYILTNPAPKSAAEFYLIEENYSVFVNDVKTRGLNYATETEIQMATIRETAQKEAYWEVIHKDFEEMERKIASDKVNGFIKYKDLIKKALEEEIAYRYFGQKGRFEIKLRDDHEVKKALELLNDPMAYARLLQSGN